MLNVLPHHLEHLRQSGLTDATIESAGIHSETALPKILVLLDTKTFPATMPTRHRLPLLRSGMVTTGILVFGPTIPAKSGGKPIKYESPRGQPNQIYIPPKVAEVLPNPAKNC